MTYLCVKNNEVVNAIVIEDTSVLSHFAAGYDFLVDLDTISQREKPWIGWSTLDGKTFEPPQEIQVKTPEEKLLNNEDMSLREIQSVLKTIAEKPI